MGFGQFFGGEGVGEGSKILVALKKNSDDILIFLN